MDECVRVTMRGPALAVLCLSEWLQLHALEPAESSGTLEMRTETAEFCVDLPVDLVYEIIEAPAEVASLRRIGPERAPDPSTRAHTVTYLLRMELPNPRYDGAV